MSGPSEREPIVVGIDVGVRRRSPARCAEASATAASGRACWPVSDAERYDLAADPFELNNLSPADPETPQHETEAVLRGRLAALRRCAGIEGRDPPPPGGYFRE